MVADAATRQVILVRAVIGRPTLDTWLWNGTTWKQLAPATSPPIGTFDAAYDVTHGKVVLLVQVSPPSVPTGMWSGCYPSQTWTWDGTTWTLASSSALTDGEPPGAPGGIGGAVMGFDAGTGQVLHYGGICQASMGSLIIGSTWLWNGATWTAAPTTTDPGSLVEAASGQDPVTGNLVVFGGKAGWNVDGTDETWTFTGGNWVRLTTPVAPPQRAWATATLDQANHRLVLFGGGSWDESYTDTWAWDGHAWTQLAPAVSPPYYAAPHLVTEPGTGRPLLVGGDISTVPPDSVTDTWRLITPATAPSAPRSVIASPRARAAMVQWRAPTSSGGAAITRYTVTAVPGGRSCSTAGRLVCTVTGLTNRVAYRFSVRATNAAGPGPASVLSAPVVVGTAVAPRIRSVSFPTRTSVRVTWLPPVHVGSGPVTRYLVRWSATGGRTWSPWTSTGRSRIAAHARMRSGHGYVFQVRAVNRSGAGLIAQVRFTQHA